MAQILSINMNAETFTSTLPEGIVGDVAALELITPANVKSIVVANDGDYEENLDGEFTVTLNNGDTIRIDGYNGLWEIKSFDKLKKSARNETIDIFREWAQDEVKYMLDPNA
jgi:hypothetical protein